MSDTCVKKQGDWKCGKPAVATDAHGRTLCQMHYDAWRKKIDKPKYGYFNKDTMTVQFGGERSKPENRFMATAIKVPVFKYTVQERESLGNGWYGGMETVEYTEDTAHIIFKDGALIGWMKCWHMRGDYLWMMETAPKQVKQFAEKYLKEHPESLTTVK